MSDTPETDAESMDIVCWHEDPLHKMEYEKSKNGDIVPSDFARRLERERDEARRDVAEILSCINRAIDSHKRHERISSAWLLTNLLDVINQMRKRNEHTHIGKWKEEA